VGGLPCRSPTSRGRTDAPISRHCSHASTNTDCEFTPSRLDGSSKICRPASEHVRSRLPTCRLDFLVITTLAFISASVGLHAVTRLVVHLSAHDGWHHQPTFSFLAETSQSPAASKPIGICPCPLARFQHRSWDRNNV
jgi:hypothetical protein